MGLRQATLNNISTLICTVGVGLITFRHGWGKPYGLSVICDAKLRGNNNNNKKNNVDNIDNDKKYSIISEGRPTRKRIGKENNNLKVTRERKREKTS